MQKITKKAIIENINEITEFVDLELEKLDCDMKTQMHIDVAIDEIVSNVAYYAYGDKVGDITVLLDYHEETRELELTFIDSGIPFNPLEKSDPDINQTLDERKIGGLGIFIVKKTMDKISYTYADGKNILKIAKIL